MSTSRFPVRHLAGMTALGGTAILLVVLHPFLVDAWAPQANDVSGRIAEMRRNLPLNLSDGSVLDGIERDGTRLTLNLVVDDRLDLAPIRDGDRDEKCETWGPALRSRSLTSIEYRYSQTGATSSLFLDRTVCG